MTIVMRGTEEMTNEEAEANEQRLNTVNYMDANNTLESDEGLGGNEGEENGEVDLEPNFPQTELVRLNDMINRTRWVVPVLPGGELEILLNASIDLCRRGLDTKSAECQRFFREGLTISFTKILTDDAVTGWKYEIHSAIMRNCDRLVELCVLKLDQDWFPLLDLLAMVLNPGNKFHTFTSNRPSETVPPGAVESDEYFAQPQDPRTPRGWLVDLINRFGNLGGFRILLDRFQSGQNLNVPVIYALLRPFGLSYELLTLPTIEKYFLPIIEMVPKHLENLPDSELKKEAKNESSKNDALSAIVKGLKCLVSRLTSHPNLEDLMKRLEIFRLKMILRFLQISSFNGKMNALNEVNKVISNVSYPHRHPGGLEEEEWLTAQRMAEWIKENEVLQIVLRDSLHQPQYVEKLEKIIRFIIKEKALTMEDLDTIWAAQVGKHEAIVKNVHDLLTKLAWDFSPEQLDHLFQCFQTSWSSANQKQQEKLLELIRRLAEDDKEGVMANKVLNLLWNLAHSEDVPTEIIDQALTAHVKILDYSCSQDRDAQKQHWLNKCVEELRDKDVWVIPALKQIREICALYTEAPQNFVHTQKNPHMLYRHEVINRLQSSHTLVVLIANNLSAYMERIRAYVKEHPDTDPKEYLPDERYNHNIQVQERLSFLRFLLKDGQLWLCEQQAKQVWQCLAEQAVFPCDREACFRWFSKLMGEEPDLDPDINRQFFEGNILMFDPTLLTESGMKCFERFFRQVNTKEGKLIPKRRTHQMDHFELIGLDYLWKVILHSGDEIATRAIELLKETSTNLGPRLQANQAEIHEDFISSCMDRLKSFYDTFSILDKERDGGDRVDVEVTRMCRVLRVLHEYISETDNDYHDERLLLPLSRAYHGKSLSVTVRFPNQGKQVEELDLWSHTNETLGTVRRHILQQLKLAAPSPGMKVDLFLNGEILDPGTEDRKLISQISLSDKALPTEFLPDCLRRILTGKLVPANPMPSSPDSSSDSSAGSPQHQYDGPNAEAENALPGVLLSQQSKYTQFLFKLCDLGSSLKHTLLRDSARALLQLVPADSGTVQMLRDTCAQTASKTSSGTVAKEVEQIFFCSSHAESLYRLEVLYALLMPANIAHPNVSQQQMAFHYNFVKSGGIPIIMSLLTQNNFLNEADMHTKRAAYQVVVRLLKLLLTVAASAVAAHASEGQQYIMPLQQALRNIPNPTADAMVRQAAMQLGQSLQKEAAAHLPDLQLIQRLIWLAWSAAAGCVDRAASATLEDLMQIRPQILHPDRDPEDLILCRETLETLSVAVALQPQCLEVLVQDPSFGWSLHILDLLLLSSSRLVRVTAAEQFYLMATQCSVSSNPPTFFISLIFSALFTTVTDNAKNSHELFQLLCRLLNSASSCNIMMQNVDSQLKAEISWLKDVKVNVKNTGETGVEETLLEGHLGVTRELVNFLPPEKKFQIGSCQEKKILLIQDLVEDFVFPASKLVAVSMRSSGSGDSVLAEQATPVCSSPISTAAVFDLLVALCTGCVKNLAVVCRMLTEMYYSDTAEPLIEWEYLPPVGPRPSKGFVGLKNAGATCYMNSVLQQLFMIKAIRLDVLSAEGAATDLDEDFSGEERLDVEHPLETIDDEGLSEEECRREYNIGILKQVQAIFGHLAASKLQYYVPRGLWKHFRIANEPVNLREQHDALEFYNSLVDSIDEALKALGQPQVMSKYLGGSFADQKICRGCPHRYSREESFTSLNIDIRNHSTLLDSLEQYVKGDLLEGDNAYYCEKCDRKVDTMKRMCIKRLPQIMVFQLKRFEYDWERECAIKSNEYFEFPRELDVEPFTGEFGFFFRLGCVSECLRKMNGLANIDGDVIQDEEDLTSGRRCSRYKLTGIVVHSGQASGGHYYSYVLHRHTDGTQRWYKFDDGEVSECHMDDDEEMKSQCFGGEYMGEVFDHLSKRMNCRRQKRWWNAYILFYTRLDVDEQLLQDSFKELSLDWTNSFPKMPAPIERSVRRENVRFMHNRNQFSVEYFQFIKKLVICNNHFVSLPAGDGTLSPEGEEIAMMSMQLVSRFLFITGWHTKKSLRGPAIEWYEALSIHLRGSRTVRSWFAQNVLFAPNYKARFTEYMLECPSSEVRMAFVKVIMFVAHFSLQDGPSPLPYGPAGMDTGEQLSNALIQAVLSLLKKEVSEHGRHLAQYFSFFHMYASLGIKEKLQLLKLNVPALLMQVAMDEGPGPAIKYQYAELGKLYQVVSLLVRCCDVSSRCQPSTPGVKVLPNPYIGDQHCSEPLMPIQPQVADMLYVRPAYMKKIMEEANAGEDTARLLKFCSWENPVFSSAALAELLWQISYSYTYELRPYLDLLLHLLLMEDSWQSQRIVKALKGISEDREGLFDTVHRSKSHHQKRAYQCIKAMVSLFTTCNVALRILQTQAELRRRWSWAVNWLHEELERRPYPGSSQYGYNSWSPPAPSNETSNGYFLERSNSAKMTLQKALEICPDEEGEGEEVAGGEDGEGGPGSPVPEDGVVPQVPSPSPVPGTATVGKLSRGSGDTRASTTTQSLSNPLVYSSIQPQERESPLSPLQPPLSSHVQFMPQRRLSGGDQRGSDKLFGFRPEDGQSTEEA